MKKLLLAIPLIAAASWAGATYYTGAQTQSAYDQLLAQLNELKPLTLVNESYAAGLVNSTAVTKVMDSATADAKVLFRLHHTIHHSPIGMNDGAVRMGAASIQTTLIRDDSVPDSVIAFLDDFDDAEPFQINTTVSFDGTTINQLLLSGYEQQHGELTVQFDGAEYSVTMKGDSLVGSGTIGELLVSADDASLRLSPGTITSNLTRVSQAVYAGAYAVEFDKLSMPANSRMPFDLALQSIGLSSDTRVDNDLLESRSGFSIGNIDSPLPLKSAAIEAKVTNLSLSGFTQYVEKISQLSATDLMLSDDPALAMQILDAMAPIVAGGTGLDYKVTLGNAGGDASLAYGISVIEASSPHFPAGGLRSISTVRDLLSVLKLEAHLDADAAAIDQTPLAMYVNSPEASQVIIADGTRYIADVIVSELIVDINGNPLSLEMMMGDMLDMPLSSLMSL